MTRAWMVRAGGSGEYERTALSEGLLIASWPGDLGDLSRFQDRQALRAQLDAFYPEENPQRLSSWTGQLWTLLWDMAKGDWGVIPLKTGKVAIGRITGPYAFRADAAKGRQHVRPVEWLRTDLPRSAIRPDLRSVLGSLLTICELSSRDAVSRIGCLAAGEADPGDSDEPEAIRALQGPADLADQINAGKRIAMPIRSLLGLWDSGQRRPDVVATIRNDLARFGLSTTPPFTEGSIDTEIEIVSIGEGPDGTSRTPAKDLANRRVEDTDAETAPPLSFLISNIPSARRELVTVAIDDDLMTAQTRMVDGGFDQLPVLNGDGRFLGAISWASIGRATMSRDHPSVADALDNAAPHARPHEPLLYRIADIAKTGYAFVVEADGTPVGIVTAADVTDRYGQDLRPIVMLEEVERRLRRAFAVFTSRELFRYAKQVKEQRIDGEEQKRGPLTPEKLVFKEYENLLADDGCWKRLAWRIKRDILLSRLADVRQVRNSVAHFHPDPISDDDLRAIESLLALLRTADPRP